MTDLIEAVEAIRANPDDHKEFEEDYIFGWVNACNAVLRLLHARRPKPPSLKEQALDQLRRVNAVLQFQTDGGETSVIRRALEALPND